MAGKLSIGSRGLKHHLAERTRLRVPRRHRSVDTMSRIQEALCRIGSVKEVETNAKTGSVLVLHRNDINVLSAMEKAILEVAPEALDEMTREENTEADNVSIIASFIGTYATRANRRFSSYTGNQLDLKTLLPLIFFGLGVQRAADTERWWSHTPAYLFFYWAYDAFLRFHLYRIEERKQNGFLPVSLNN
ncbi:MAG: HMA2 domain-containing protein [Candidatus Obscuribacterales bacterium]